MQFPCIDCAKEVQPRQHAVLCESCERWQHRTCKTAAWLAVREVFPLATIKGCVFHYTQAVWRKVQDLGLKTIYMDRASIHSYIRQLMALPFLPAAHIEPAFRELARRANSQKLADLVTYIERQWISHSVFDVKSWSVFGLSVRTNNDVEGWHHRLNRLAGHQCLSFYRLVPKRSRAPVL